MKKSILKLIIGITFISICIILFLNASFILQIFSRNFYFREYIKDNNEIYFLGTTHTMSLDSEPFSYLELKAVIENLKPDLVLIESRSAQLDNGNWADGPPEMLYCHLIANRLGIRVKGVDWWTVSNDNIPNSSNPVRDRHIHENIIKNIDLYKSKRTLIVMGRAHVVLEQPKLKNSGYKKDFFSIIEKSKLFKVYDRKLVFPKGMNFYVKKRIIYEKNCIGTVYKTDIWKKSALEGIKSLNRESKIIQQIGES